MALFMSCFKGTSVFYNYKNIHPGFLGEIIFLKQAVSQALFMESSILFKIIPIIQNAVFFIC